jgi:hypothetical protein
MADPLRELARPNRIRVVLLIDERQLQEFLETGAVARA